MGYINLISYDANEYLKNGCQICVNLATLYITCALICHGIFDFYEANYLAISPPIFNISYQLIFILFMTLLACSTGNAVTIFVLLSMYHFGDDFRYIMVGDYLEILMGGILVGSTALNKKGANEWSDLIHGFYSPGFHLSNMDANTISIVSNMYCINILVTMIQILGTMSFVWYMIYSGSVFYRCLAVFVFAVCSRLTPSKCIFPYFAYIHVPLAAYRAWLAFGWPAINMWLIVSLVVTIIVASVFSHVSRHIEEYKFTASSALVWYIQFGMYGITIPHIIITSIWHLYSKF